MISETLASQIVDLILKRASPERILIFGSQARDDSRRGSDIDIAVFGIPRDQAASLKEDLNEELETLKDVDVVAFEALTNENLKQRILSEGKAIYERNAG